ncbi:MAG: lamin tail domain-containing protein, partial [Acidobacteria bacterium]|nr:lamin tail domain-containing protein [Acidobacteriota bacterium]
FIVGNATLNFADFPMLGYNQNFVAVAVNMFNTSNAFVEGRVLALDYPQLRAGTAVATLFTGITSGNGGFCFHPVTTFSPTEPTLYFVSHLSSAGATYKVSAMTGTPSAPVLTVGATQTRPGGGWTQPSGDILPQTCVGTPGVTCPTTLRFIDVGDAQVRSNPAFRNGNVYYSQTVGIPAGGLTHTAAQWTVVNAVTAAFVDGGRVEDPTATNANGGKWYGYPSITANKNGDIMLGFTQFASNQFASAGYAFRLAGDAAATMRDPFIYKAGEDYYAKTFSGTRNRFGDYSHTLVDPSNDRDMWTLQEYAGTRTVADANSVTNNSRWATWWAKITAPVGATDLLISEFRLRGLNGTNDEFIELYNNNDTPLTIQTLDGSAGYSVAASDGAARFTVPNGTAIPARGHYLGVNSVGYSLASYPAGNGTTATGDATYTTDIPDNAGIALFNTATAASFTLGNRLDAAGSTSEANTLYKEGTGYPALTPPVPSIDYSFYRSNCPNNGPTGSILGCLSTGTGRPKDSNNNSADFVFVDTNGTTAGAGQRLGAPGPENLSSPVQKLNVAVTLLDPGVAASVAPNRVRDFTSDAGNNSTFGTLTIRRTVTNNTGASITRLRFRIIDFTTFPAPSGTADLRARTSGVAPVVVTITGPNPACPANSCVVQQTTLEEPPSQPNGGGFNSTLSAGTVTLGTPIANGASINVQFLLGIQQTGNFRFFINVEALP